MRVTKMFTAMLLVAATAVTVWLASVDWIMALGREWARTIFGVYHFARAATRVPARTPEPQLNGWDLALALGTFAAVGWAATKQERTTPVMAVAEPVVIPVRN